MNSEEFIKKVNDRSLTLGEALRHISTRPDANVSNMKGLINHYDNPETPIDSNAKFFEIYETKPFAETVGYPTNRFAAFGAFETLFKKSLGPTNFKSSDYKKITGKGGTADGFGLGGTQNRGKDPMRGTIYSKDVDAVYQDALSKSTYVDKKTGKTVTIDQDTRDFMIYEKYTGQRVETNIGDGGLKLSDLIPGVDPETGQVYVDVQAKVSGQKTRPAVRYTDEFAEFLIDKLEKAKEAAGSDANFTKIDLFKTNKSKVDGVWNNTIRPQLETKFEAQLPLDKASGRGKAPPKVIRKILARQLVHEFSYPSDIVKSWMGHAGAGVSTSGDILVDNYIGVVPDDRIGLVSNNLIRNDGFNIKAGTANSLFAGRGLKIKGFSVEANKGYNSFDKIHKYGPSKVDPANIAQKTGLLQSEKKKINAANKKITAQYELDEIQINIQKEDKLSELTDKQIANLAKKENLTLEQYKTQEIEKANKAKLKKELASDAVPDSPEKFSDGLKAVLKNMGINIEEVAKSPVTKAVATTAAVVGSTVAKSLPVVPGALEYTQSKEEGRGEYESAARAGIEAVNPLPVGIRDVEETIESGVKKASEDSKDSGSFLDALSGSLTGMPMGLAGGYSSGGFVNKAE
mgnify:CR=1 FL=1|tara:strand:+ start:49 stop:1938 length:1890 start_codon:yes stop_codon:yes gene_type:complete